MTIWVILFGSRVNTAGENGSKTFASEKEAEDCFNEMDYSSDSKYVSDRKNSILVEIELPDEFKK